MFMMAFVSVLDLAFGKPCSRSSPAARASSTRARPAGRSAPVGREPDTNLEFSDGENDGAARVDLGLLRSRPRRRSPSETAEVDESVEATDESADATPDAERRGRRRRGRPTRTPPRPRGRGRGRGPARGLPPRAVDQAGRLVRGPHLLRHGEPGEVQPGEPHHLPQHGGLHPRDRGPHRGGRGDQERPAQDGQAHRPARLRPGPDGPHRRVLVGRPPHARRSPASSATATSRCR